MRRELLWQEGGRFFGHLHHHSDPSDGQVPPQDVVTAYREADCDFVVLSD